jgi:hypothetical protein
MPARAFAFGCPLFFIIVSVGHQYLEVEIFKASKWGFGICSEQQ